MSIANLLTDNNYDIYCDNIELNTINGSPYNPSAAPIPSLLPNKFLRTTNNVSPTLFWGDVTPSELVHGLPNQILCTNTLGTAAEWRSSLNIPNNLLVNGSTTLNDNVLINQDCAVLGNTNLNNLDIDGNLSFLGNSGNVGFILTKTGPNTQNWALNPPVRCVRYTKYLSAQNLNSSASPTAMLFDLPGVVADIASGTTASVLGFLQVNNTTFRSQFTALYDIDFTIYIDNNSSGIGNSIVAVSVEIAGVEQNFCALTNCASNSISGKLPSLLLQANQNIRILLRRVAGAGQLNCFGPASIAPNFASTITFSLVRIIQ